MNEVTLTQRYEKKIKQQQHIITLTKSLTSNIPLDKFLNKILDIIDEEFPTRKMYIYLQESPDDKSLSLYNNTLDLKYSDEKQTISFKHPIFIFLNNWKDGITWERLKIESDKLEGIWNDIIQQWEELRIELIYPLYTHNNIHGLLLLGKQNRDTIYSTEDDSFLWDLSMILSLKLEHKELYEQSNRDPLTQLYNRNYLQKNLRTYIENIYSSNTYTFSILFIDIDNFKKINDILGHPFGDIVLKLVAIELRNRIKKEDILSRYGGEEFIILLDNKNLETALQYAESIRRAIPKILSSYNNLQNQKIEIPPTLEVTISIGVGEFKRNIDTFESILERCDKALYLAKKNGRNRIEITS